MYPLFGDPSVSISYSENTILIMIIFLNFMMKICTIVIFRFQIESNSTLKFIQIDLYNLLF